MWDKKHKCFLDSDVNKELIKFRNVFERKPFISSIREKGNPYVVHLKYIDNPVKH
jgi:hypothetical protein